MGLDLGAFRASRMFDRAPMLFGPRGDLSEVGEYPVNVGAIFTIKFLEKV